MAQSRLEKIGTIFSRVTGLLKSGAMKPEDKPLWYEIYVAFPPKIEPKFDRPIPIIPLRKIFYEEDAIRAHYHKLAKGQDNINLNDNKNSTQCQQYIQIYNSLKSEGALSDDKIKEVAYDMLKDKSTVTSFEKFTINEDVEDTKPVDANEKQIPPINIKDIF